MAAHHQEQIGGHGHIALIIGIALPYLNQDFIRFGSDDLRIKRVGKLKFDKAFFVDNAHRTPDA